MSQRDDSVVCWVLSARPGSAQWAQRLIIVAEVQGSSTGWANGPVISLS